MGEPYLRIFFYLCTLGIATGSAHHASPLMLDSTATIRAGALSISNGHFQLLNLIFLWLTRLCVEILIGK